MTTPKLIEKPMPFKAPMVRAILEGRKTQTRRIVKPQPDCEVQDLPYWNVGRWRLRDDAPNPLKCPHPVGSRIWVRETWQVIHCVPEYSEGYATGYADEWFAADNIPKSSEDGWWVPVYKATDAAADDHVEDRGYKYRPSTYMPRWVSRITLEVTDVRVQRLQEIDGMDAKAEGVIIPAHIPHNGADMDWARREFKALWNSINGPDAWEQNPWVWAYTFRRVEVDDDHA